MPRSEPRGISTLTASSGLSPPSHPATTTCTGTAPVKTLRAMPGARETPIDISVDGLEGFDLCLEVVVEPNTGGAAYIPVKPERSHRRAHEREQVLRRKNSRRIQLIEPPLGSNTSGSQICVIQQIVYIERSGPRFRRKPKPQIDSVDSWSFRDIYEVSVMLANVPAA